MSNRKYLTGRQITKRSVIAALLGALLAVAVNAQTSVEKILELVVITPTTGDGQYYSSGDSTPALAQRAVTHFQEGVVLGAEEADRTGRLIGWKVRLRIVRTLAAANESSDVDPIIFSATPFPGSVKKRTMIITGFGSRNRGACNANSFSIAPTAFSASSSLWDSTAERFGAAQLNDRFRMRFHEGMDSNAWAGWVAVKAVTEAAFRTGSSRTQEIRKYLLDPATRLDGHKGIPLHFSESRTLVVDSTSHGASQCG